MVFKFLKKVGSPLSGSRIYLDYAAATPVSEEVRESMERTTRELWGNASAIHREGTNARKAIEAARLSVARVLAVRPEHVLFTGNGTESNNLVLFGLVEQLQSLGRSYDDMEILSTRLEHPSITEALQALESRGVAVVYLPVDGEGHITEVGLEKSLSKKTVLVTFAYSNSEIGVVQEVKRITRQVKKFNTEHSTSIKVHLDASQSPLWLPCKLDMLGADLMTLDAGKCYGPKGVGVLAYRQGVALTRQHFGGGQEHGLRAGTESTPLIVGCAESIVRAQNTWETRAKRVSALRDTMIELLEKNIEGVVLNGPRESRVANNVNISIPGMNSEFAVVTLDAQGIAASTKSACSTGKGGGSKVVMEISQSTERAESTIRFSLGEETTRSDIERAVTTLSEHVERMRKYPSASV